MGSGVAIFNIEPYNYYEQDSIILFIDSNEFVLKLIDDPINGGLKFNDQRYKNFINPFTEATTYLPAYFIWQQGESGEILIQSYNEQKKYIVKDTSKIHRISWNLFLRHSRISISEKPFFLKESSGQYVKSGTLSGVFDITDVTGEWIQVRHIDKDDLYGKKKIEPSGWIKWFSNDSIQIGQFLDDTFFESYYKQ